VSSKVVAGVVAVAAMAGVLLLVKYGPANQPSAERGMLLHLPLHTDLRDHSRFDHPVKVNGSVHLEEGAARFSGDGWLSVPHLAIDKRLFAISMWIKPAGPWAYQGLFEQKDNDQVNHHLHVALVSGHLYFAFLGNDARSKKRVQEKQWNHLVFVFTGQQQKIWLNGQKVTEAGANAYEGTQGDTCIGRHPEVPYMRDAADFDGWMRDVRVYEGPFDGERVLALQQRGPTAD
jgi:hypothetical protein